MDMQPYKISELSRSQFERYCAFIYNECGISLNQEKRELLNARIGKRLRQLRMQPDTYLELVQADTDERDRFLEAVSTHHTFFPRESSTFRHIDPECRSSWCAAASSGEEAYSLAAFCFDRGIRVSIWATDISESCLQRCHQAVYPIGASQHTPPAILKKCFQKGRNLWEGYFRPKSEIRQMVRFDRFNLLKDPVPDPCFDIVCCRNVMIYFDKRIKEQVLQSLIRVVKPSEYFIIGGAESLNGLAHTLRYFEPSVYQRP